MKKLKIAAFASLLLFLILHIITEYCIIMECGGRLYHSVFILKQYEMISKYIAIPIVLIYLYKRLK